MLAMMLPLQPKIKISEYEVKCPFKTNINKQQSKHNNELPW